MYFSNVFLLILYIAKLHCIISEGLFEVHQRVFRSDPINFPKEPFSKPFLKKTFFKKQFFLLLVFRILTLRNLLRYKEPSGSIDV